MRGEKQRSSDVEARGGGPANSPPGGKVHDGARASPPACRDGGPPPEPTVPPPPRGDENGGEDGTGRCRRHRSTAPNSSMRPPPRDEIPVVRRDHRADGASAPGSRCGARHRAHPRSPSLVAAGMTGYSSNRRRQDPEEEFRTEDRRCRRKAPMMPNTCRTVPDFLQAVVARNVDRDPEAALRQRRSTRPPYARHVW